MAALIAAVNPTVPEGHSVLVGSSLAMLGLIIFCAIGAAIGHTKGHPVLGAALGVFGPIGWLIAVLLPSRAREVEPTLEHV